MQKTNITYFIPYVDARIKTKLKKYNLKVEGVLEKGNGNCVNMCNSYALIIIKIKNSDKVPC
jgi:Fe-S-cluster-containing dehydrogenase component